ncbi:hypothetical protein Tco_0666442 [Tanacetum coccineum]
MLFIMPSWKHVNPPYKFKLTEKTITVAEGRIDNDIYSTVDACPNACEIWKAIERLKQDGESLESYYSRFYKMMNELVRNQCDVTNHQVNVQFLLQLQPEWQRKKEIDKLMALISLSFKKIYKPTNNNLRTSSNTNRANQDNTPRINKGTGHVAKECQKPKRAKDAAYHKEKILLSRYMYMAQIQEVTPDVVDNSGPIFDIEPLHKDDDDLARERDLLASLIEKLKCEIDDNKIKFQAELDRYHDVNYASKVAIDCAKAKADLMSYKMESEKSFNEYTQKINDLNQTISEVEKELFAHQKTISIKSQEKEAQKKFHKTREDKKLEKVIALENKIKVLDDIVYKTGQSIQTMNMLNRNCKTSFVKPEFLKKAQRANPRLYDISCYNDNLALMLAPKSDETIRLAQESWSRLRDLMRPFDYKNLNNLYDLFVPQREKSPEHRYFSEREYYYANHTNAILGAYTTLDEFIDLQCDYVDQVVKCERLEKELSKTNITSKSFEALQQHVIDLELALQQYLKAQLQDKGIAISKLKKLIEKMKGKSMETKFEKPSVIRQPNAFKSQRQLVLGKLATFSDSLTKIDFSKSNSVTTLNVSNDFSKPVTAQILPQNVKTILKNTNVFALGMYKVHTKPNQTRTPQLPQDIRKTNKHVYFSIGVIPTTSVSRSWLKSNRLKDRVMHNNSERKKQQVEYHHRNFKFSNNKTTVTACNDNLNAKTSNVKFVCVTCGKCVLNDNHDMCVLQYINGVNSLTKMHMVVPISTREPKRTVNQSVATPLRRIVASESTYRNLEAQLQSNMRRLVRHVNGGILSLQHLDTNGNLSVPLYPILHCLRILLKLLEIILFIIDFGCSKHMTGNRKLLSNFMDKYLGTMKFGNDQSAPILGYEDLVQGNITIKRVYYVKGLNHNLFSVGQFCDADLEVAFRKTTCYIRDLKGNDLLTAETVTMSNELDLLFSLMFDELLNGTTQVVSKSSAVTTVDTPNQQTNKEYAQVDEDEFINIFSTPVQEREETSSRHVVSSNMYTFYQRHPSEHRWIKDHPLEQVIGDPSQSIRTRRQLETDGEMCMFALTVSRTEPKIIKEAMADSAWIEAMQEELHQFDRLDVWELVDRPFCKNVIDMKWLWKNKRDEENTVIRNKAHLVAKG